MTARVSASDMLTLQLKMLEAFTEAEGFLTSRDIQEILDLSGVSVRLRSIQRQTKLFTDMGLITVCPKDTLPVGCGLRYKKSCKIAVCFDHT